MPERQTNSRDYSWPFWPILPLYPYGRRRTIRKEVVENTIWTFDQIQGIFYVITPVRMTIVRLESGGLLVYAPVAPTPECIRLVKELVAEHGDVKYIILSTVSAVEHKAFVGPFARCFPKAQVFVAPNQWSFPVSVPLSWLGFPPKRTQFLPADSSQVPFSEEFDYAILGPIYLGPGWFEEAVLFHRRSRTLLVTEMVVSVPDDPPAIVQLDTYPLLFHARDTASDPFEDTPENRRKGWQRQALFTLYFRPNVLEVPQWGQVIRNATKASDRSKKGYFGIYPFKWKANWERSFEALRGNGRLFVAPILQTLILNRAPKETLAWANRVASWEFERIISCHFDSPIKATPAQFRQAFAFLEKHPDVDAVNTSTYPLPKEDFQVLKEIDQGLSGSGIVPPPRERV